MPLTAILGEPRYRQLRDRIQATLPWLFTHRFDLLSDLPPGECLKILEAETSPMSEMGKTWGVKPILAEFKLPNIVLKRYCSGGSSFDPHIYLQINNLHEGSTIRYWLSPDGGERLILTVCILIGIFIFPVLIAYDTIFSYANNTLTTSNLIAGGLLIICFPSLCLLAVKLKRQDHNEITAFITNFLITKLAARLMSKTEAQEFTNNTSPAPRINVEILLTVLSLALQIFMGFSAVYAIFSLYFWLPKPYNGIMVAALLFAVLFGGAIVLLFQDPAFRKKPSVQKPEPPQDRDT